MFLLLEFVYIYKATLVKLSKFFLFPVTRWQKIQKSLAEHKHKLAAALEVHAFNRDVDDINDRINEKVSFFVQSQSLSTLVFHPQNSFSNMADSSSNNKYTCALRCFT